MAINKILLPQEIYADNLHFIKGVKFSQREIEVITCILHVRTAKKMASLLSIAPKTIESHIRNITQKLECNSREGVVNFIENSDKYLEVKNYYSYLLVLKKFEETMVEISKQISAKALSYVIVFEEKETKSFPLPLLRKHLSLVGLGEFSISSKLHSENKKPFKILINSSNTESYYLYFFHLLETIFPYLDVSSYRSVFEEYCKRLLEFHTPPHHPDRIEKPKQKKQRNRKLGMVSLFGIAALMLAGLVYFMFMQQQETTVIRSDLIIPSETTLLSRNNLIEEMDNKLNAQSGIQSIALIGIGGSGKTTLARQYARQQKASIVWEINAESHKSLLRSFERLAEALSKTEDEKRILSGFQEIKDSIEREEKLIQFIKDKLRGSPPWFLIYDNVEALKDIQPYLPNDPYTWGKGTLLITTRDSTPHNGFVHSSIVIGELDFKQKLELFLKIVEKQNSTNLSPPEKKEIQDFLGKIPSFPLDVSIAAYYLKSTDVPHQKYLSYITQDNNDFEESQTIILQEGHASTKTRYGIITVSLQKLMDTHKDIGNLLLFISLLDSQYIPRDLLTTYKNDLVVDNFIYNLKKYSLISIDHTSVSSASQTFSLHQSTQVILLNYLRKKLDFKNNKALIHQISDLFGKTLGEAIDQDDYMKMRSLYHHLVVFLSHPNMLPNKDKAILRSQLGYIESYLLKDNVKGKKHLEESYKLASQCFEEKDPQLGKIIIYLGVVCRRLGKYERARDLLQKGLIIYRQHYSEDHPQLKWVLAYLGNTYRILGDAKQAKLVLEQALQNYKSIPSNKAEYARTVAYLGITYKDLGDYKKSVQFLKNALHIHTTHFSSAHPDMVWILGYLGDSYRKLEDYKNAEYVLEKGLAIHNQYYSHNASEKNWFMFLLGKVYRELGKYQKARTFLEASLVYHREHFGKEHLETAHVLRSLGQTYFLEGEIDKAEIIFQEVLKNFQQQNYIDQYMVLEDISDINLKKAEEEKRKKNIGLSQSFKDKATRNLKEALQIVRAHFSENSPHIKRITEKIKLVN